MAIPLGRANLRVRLVSYDKVHCSGKLVFDNLEAILRKAGYEVRGAKSREDGRGSAPAVRVRTSGPKAISLEIATELRLVRTNDGDFNSKIVFPDLAERLESRGVHILMCETRSFRRDSALALRVNLG
jgi:hypothetical protein